MIFGYLVVAELAEAAARTGEVAQVQAALDWLSERTRVTRTEWVLGIEARVRALLGDGPAADGFYRESVERLGRTRGPRRAGPVRDLLYGGVAAPRAAPRRGAGAAAHRPPDAGGNGHEGVRRAGPP